MKQIFFLWSLLMSHIAFSQCLPDTQWRTLYNRIMRFVYNQFPKCYIVKESEMALLVLHTDSTGKIFSIDVKGDRKDSIYNFLQRMPVAVFDTWKSGTSTNKSIVIPYFYWFFEGEKSYAYRVYKEYYMKQACVETKSIIMARPMVSIAPIVEEISCPPTSFEIISDSIPKPPPVIEKKSGKTADSSGHHPPNLLRFSIAIAGCCLHRDFQLYDTITRINATVHR